MDTNLKNNSTEKSNDEEASRRSGGQEIPRLLRNPKLHYRVHKAPTAVHNLSQTIPVNMHTHYLFEIHFNIIPLYTYVQQVVSSLQDFQLKFACICNQSPAFYISCHLLLVDLIALNNI
jgi:hypothetical protein